MTQYKEWGYISKDNPRFEMWKYIMGNENPIVPLKSIIPTKTQFGIVYNGDINQFTIEQKERLIESIAKKFKLTPESIKKDLENGIFAVMCDSVGSSDILKYL